MTNYTTNIAQNPGFQLGTTGYSAVNNASFSLGSIKDSGSLLGNPGLLVSTPGVISGEGVMTFVSSIPGGSGTTFSFSTYILGLTSGSVTMYAVTNPGGAIVASTPVTLMNSYQRVAINGINVGSATSLYIIVSTTSAQAVQFWLANTQIEPSSLAHTYCDGGQIGCSWTGGVVGSTSFQQFQNTIVATSSNINATDIVNVLITGEPFNIVIKGANNFNNDNIVKTTKAFGPVGAMTDFSVASLIDPDPAQTYISWNNAGIAAPTSGYNRVWGSFIAPQKYITSGANLLYSRAAFMAAGFQFNNVPNNQKVIVTDVQVEVLPVTTGFTAPSPTSYALPREIQTIIKPTRLNYCTNPSFEVDLTGWSPVAGGVLSQDPATSVGNIIIIDDTQEVTGQASLSVAVTASGDGASTTISNLIAGDTYIVSAYVQANSSVTDIAMVCANGSTSAAHGNAGTGYGTGQYGGGFYGGNPASSTALATGQWFRIYTTFQPTDSTVTLFFTSTITAPTNFWIDAILVEPGQVLDFYFDGNFGQNFFWETGGTPGLTRSYYYDQFGVKSQAVLNVLEHHTPLGISFATPLYKTPPTQ